MTIFLVRRSHSHKSSASCSKQNYKKISLLFDYLWRHFNWWWYAKSSHGMYAKCIFWATDTQNPKDQTILIIMIITSTYFCRYWFDHCSFYRSMKHAWFYIEMPAACYHPIIGEYVGDDDDEIGMQNIK